MVIDCAKGVEERTIKLMEVCRLRDTPIMTFVNKLDRDGRAPIELLDEIESVLKIQCAPITWPIGMGRDLLGVYHLLEDRIYVYVPVEKGRVGHPRDHRRHRRATRRASFSATAIGQFLEEVELVRGASPAFDLQRYLRRASRRRCSSARRSTISACASCCPPSCSIRRGPCRARRCSARSRPTEPKLTGFVFKIQANMDPGHRDRIAFMRAVLRTLCARHAHASCAARQGSAHRRCADVSRRRPQPGRGGLCRRHHRPAQSRHHQHRRYLHRRRGADLHGRAEFRARRCSAARCSRIRCA